MKKLIHIRDDVVLKVENHKGGSSTLEVSGFTKNTTDTSASVIVELSRSDCDELAEYIRPIPSDKVKKLVEKRLAEMEEDKEFGELEGTQLGNRLLRSRDTATTVPGSKESGDRIVEGVKQERLLVPSIHIHRVYGLTVNYPKGEE